MLYRDRCGTRSGATIIRRPNIEDVGMLVYHYERPDPKRTTSQELRFASPEIFTAGRQRMQHVQMGLSRNCSDKVRSLTYCISVLHRLIFRSSAFAANDR